MVKFREAYLPISVDGMFDKIAPYFSENTEILHRKNIINLINEAEVIDGGSISFDPCADHDHDCIEAGCTGGTDTTVEVTLTYLKLDINKMERIVAIIDTCHMYGGEHKVYWIKNDQEAEEVVSDAFDILGCQPGEEYGSLISYGHTDDLEDPIPYLELVIDLEKIDEYDWHSSIQPAMIANFNWNPNGQPCWISIECGKPELRTDGSI